MKDISVSNSLPPHGNDPVLFSGNTKAPTQALILLHGRGGTARDILSLLGHISLPDTVLVVAPEAHDTTWYPKRFFEPQNNNQPDLDSALARIDTLMTFLYTQYTLPPEQIALAGFSQGACLTSEYLKRHPKRYLAAAIFSGGLIGEDSEVVTSIEGSLSGTPIYLGCDQEDFHIPKVRVEMTAHYLSEHNAQVTLRLYTQLGHSIHSEGLKFLAGVLV